MAGHLPASTSVAGAWWRHIPGGADPLFRPDTPGDGRWQRGAAVEGLYLADEPGTTWAEWYRFLAEVGLPPAQFLPRDIWDFDVHLSGIADLSSASKLAAVGLDLPQPGRRTWPAYQQCGEWLHDKGFEGVVAPSAARPDHLVLCVFGTAESRAHVIPIGPPHRQHSPPVPPTGMIT